MNKHGAEVALAAFCLLAAPAYALTACNTNDYVVAVDKIIDNAVGSRPQFASTAFPSFGSEYGVRMVGDVVYFVRLRKSFWAGSVVQDNPTRYHHDFTAAHAATSVYKSVLNRDVANRVRQLYSLVLSQPQAADSAGLDGTTYQFVSTVTCGETWSPAQKSLDGQLVELAELLAVYAKSFSSFSQRHRENEILRKLSELNRRFPENR
jgi:hypothetical protein